MILKKLINYNIWYNNGTNMTVVNMQ